MRLAVAVGVCTVIVVAFAVVVMSVVRERQGLSAQVTESFARSLQDQGLMARGESITCRKQSVDFYRCRVSSGAADDRSPRTRAYRLGLHDDGCWTVLGVSPATIRRPSDGCIGRRS